MPAQISSPCFRTGHIETEGDLRALWEIDSDGYGDSSITLDTFRDWWVACPWGLTALFEGGHVAGGLGCWPLPFSTYDSLTRGELLEAQIGEGGFGDMDESRHWYVSGVILRTSTRGKRDALPGLLAKGLRGPLEARHAAAAVHVAALGYSEEGHALGCGLGLRDAGVRTRDGLRVLMATVEEIMPGLRRVEALRARLAAGGQGTAPPDPEDDAVIWTSTKPGGNLPMDGHKSSLRL